MTFEPAWALVRVSETAAVGTATGCIVGRLLLPAIWRDLKRRLRHPVGA